MSSSQEYLCRQMDSQLWSFDDCMCLRGLQEFCGRPDSRSHDHSHPWNFSGPSIFSLAALTILIMLACCYRICRNERVHRRAEHGNVVDTRGHSGNIVSSPNRRGHTSRSHPPRPEDDLPPPYSSIHCEAPPSYEKVVGSSKSATAIATAAATATATAAATATATAAASSVSLSDSMV